MDALGLITLREEMRADCSVFLAAARAAANHFQHGTQGRLQAVAFELARGYNVIEQIALRVAREFENHFAKDGGWHEALLRRLSLAVPGVRPALWSGEFKRDLNELPRFRHLVHHAYEVSLRDDRLGELVGIASAIAPRLAEACEQFIQQVAKENGWSM